MELCKQLLLRGSELHPCTASEDDPNPISEQCAVKASVPLRLYSQVT